jgi:hypothetical protein
MVMVERPILFREVVHPVDHWYLNGWVVYDFGTDGSAAAEGFESTTGRAWMESVQD